MKALLGDDGKVEKTAKGISKNKVKTNITFDKYKKTLYENYKEYIPSNAIRSKNHHITTLTVNKLGLSNFENKRYYISNTCSLPYGHHLLLN